MGGARQWLEGRPVVRPGKDAWIWLNDLAASEPDLQGPPVLLGSGGKAGACCLCGVKESGYASIDGL